MFKSQQQRSMSRLLARRLLAIHPAAAMVLLCVRVGLAGGRSQTLTVNRSHAVCELKCDVDRLFGIRLWMQSVVYGEHRCADVGTIGSVAGLDGKEVEEGQSDQEGEYIFDILIRSVLCSFCGTSLVGRQDGEGSCCEWHSLDILYDLDIGFVFSRCHSPRGSPRLNSR